MAIPFDWIALRLGAGAVRVLGCDSWLGRVLKIMVRLRTSVNIRLKCETCNGPALFDHLGRRTGQENEGILSNACREQGTAQPAENGTWRAGRKDAMGDNVQDAIR